MKTLPQVTAALLAEMDRLVKGKSNPSKLNALTNATGKFISSIRIRLDYARAIGEKPNIPELQT